MTTYNTFADRNRDMQDSIKRHIWGHMEYVKNAGSYLHVAGNGTMDYEVPVLNLGYGFNLPKNSNAEIMVLAESFDTNQKHGFPTLPRDRQRQWKENTGGIQNPVDPSKAVEFNPKRLHLREKNIAAGESGAIEIIGNRVIIRGNLEIEGDLVVGGKISVKGGVYAEGRGIFNGDLSTPLIRSAHGSKHPDRTSVDINIPKFEDYHE